MIETAIGRLRAISRSLEWKLFVKSHWMAGFWSSEITISHKRRSHMESQQIICCFILNFTRTILTGIVWIFISANIRLLWSSSSSIFSVPHSVLSNSVHGSLSVQFHLREDAHFVFLQYQANNRILMWWHWIYAIPLLWHVDLLTCWVAELLTRWTLKIEIIRKENQY